jgi:hypothetical protein
VHGKQLPPRLSVSWGPSKPVTVWSQSSHVLLNPSANRRPAGSQFQPGSELPLREGEETKRTREVSMQQCAVVAVGLGVAELEPVQLLAGREENGDMMK